MREFIDQIGVKRTLPASPQSVISLVPSQTVYLAALGCDREVVGITKFCIEPEHWFKNKRRVGGTKKLKMDRIAALNPDLIIGNKEENSEGDINKLQEYNLWISDIESLSDALEMMQSIGVILNKEAKAEKIIRTIHTNRNEFRSNIGKERPRVAYLIWRNPYMVAAGNTFIDTMLREAGFQNIYNDRERYPEVTRRELARKDPDYIFLSTEPFPFKEKHIEEWNHFFPAEMVQIVDAVPFSWYGSHLMNAYAYFNTLRQELNL